MAKHLLSLSWDRSKGFLRLVDEGNWLKPAARDRLERELIPRYEKLVHLDGKEVKVSGLLQDSGHPTILRVRVIRRQEDSPRCPTVMLIHDGNRTPVKGRPQGVPPEWAEQFLEELDDLVPAWMFEGVSRQEVAGLKLTIDHLRQTLGNHPRRAGELLLLGYLTWFHPRLASQAISEQWDAVREILSGRVKVAPGHAGKEMARVPFAFSENVT